MGASDTSGSAKPWGLVTRRITSAVETAVDKITTALQGLNIGLAARVDHAAAAAAAGLSMPPSVVLIFGNPKAGTPLMAAVPTIAIDLPLKLLVWEAADGSRWVGYNDPLWIAERHGGDDLPRTTLQAMKDLLERLSLVAAGA